MRREAATWLHVSGYRYLLRRTERALLGSDLRVVDGSPRKHATALALGCVLAVIILAGCGLLSWLRPQSGPGDARIAMGQVSGALYVRVGDTWHPVLNLASARLVAATDTNPQPVRESELARVKRGPLLGIPGAPQLLSPPLPISESVWTICDSESGAGTTVLIGAPTGSGVRRLSADEAILVATPDRGSPVYLLYRGRRAMVDLADRAVVRALRLQDQVPRTISQSLLNALPEAPAIAAPRIRGAGGPAGAWLPGIPVGSVLRITLASSAEYYAVLGTGVQRIGQVAADLLRFSVALGPAGRAGVISVAPEVLRAAPIVDTLPVSGFPDQAPTPSDGPGSHTVCVAWAPAQSGPADIALLTGSGPPVPAGQQAVALAQADGRGPAVDAVYLPPGRSAYVVAQSLTGTGARVGGRFLVTETGVRFAIHDDDAAHDLGLASAPAPAPWPVLTALPGGPELGRANALLARDTVGAGP
jgi:type VII secretion protein EccB